MLGTLAFFIALFQYSLCRIVYCCRSPSKAMGSREIGFLRGYRPLWAFWNGQDWSLLMDYSVGKVLFSQFWFCQKWAGVCEGATTERCTRKGDNRPPIPLRAATFAKQWP
jgi:hypothetical protein